MAITLTRSKVTPEVVSGAQHVWPLRVTAVSSLSGLPSEIFVYHANMDSDQINDLDIFECVASVPQLDEIGTAAVPANPDADPPTDAIPYYRSATLEFGCRSAREAWELWMKIQEDVQDLVDNFRCWTMLDNPQEPSFESETVVIS